MKRKEEPLPKTRRNKKRTKGERGYRKWKKSGKITLETDGGLGNRKGSQDEVKFEDKIKERTAMPRKGGGNKVAKEKKEDWTGNHGRKISGKRGHYHIVGKKDSKGAVKSNLGKF